jgi:magnesium chelatase subunit H
MKPKRISAAEGTGLKVVIVTLDHHLSSACDQAAERLASEMAGLELVMHAAADWEQRLGSLDRCLADIADADILFVSMLFLEDHVRTIKPALEARRESVRGLLCCMSAGELVKLSRLGKFDMSAPESPAMAFLKRMRGSNSGKPSSGSQQMAMLRRLPQILKFIPGAAQDMRAYFLGMQYWLSGSEENLINLVRMLVERYARDWQPARALKTRVQAPVIYPDVGLYHPRLPDRMTESLDDLPGVRGLPGTANTSNFRGTVGLLVFRSYVLSGDSAHYDGVIAALEHRGLRVVPAFANGLDARPAIDRFFVDRQGRTTIDALVSLTGFSLVGGPAYNDATAAADVLGKLDVPYLAAHPLEFQSLEQWESSDRGLMPVESTIMVAIPELDGATGPMVYGGRGLGGDSALPPGCAKGCLKPCGRCMQVHPERAAKLAARVDKLVELRRTERSRRRVALILFNFPPNSGGIGTAQNLAVFESLHHTMRAMHAEGYSIEVPATVDALRARILEGNGRRYGTEANVHARVSAADHVRREPYLKEIEGQWGPAPGRELSDGGNVFILGERFGEVFVGIQPSIGYEGDPMRLLFEGGFAPTHAFSVFYRWLREDFAAHAVVHFGTHGALEFMPGKQTGMAASCWPDRLIGDLPNIYLYAANNPSEGAIAKRRSAATLISYLTPPVARAGLYRGLLDLKASLERWRALPPEALLERQDMRELLAEQSVSLDLLVGDAGWDSPEDAILVRLWDAVLELEQTLIPEGLHVMGEVPTIAERAELLSAMAEGSHGRPLPLAAAALLAAGHSAKESAQGDLDIEPILESLAMAARLLANDHEIAALMRALDARFIQPAPGGDLLRTPEILPTGRNVHGFDPFRLPTAFALRDGAKQAQRLLERHIADGNPLPRSIALVLWGTDTLKTEGSPIGLALGLMGAKPRFDSYGRLCGAELVGLAELGRPRVDVVVTLSGIFRDLMPLQTKLLAEAALLCAQAEESEADNPVRANTLAYLAQHGGDFATAALRVFSNADGAYGANVSNLVYSSNWEQDEEIADTYTARKCFAYGVDGRPTAQPKLLQSALAKVDLAYQNLDSLELGVTTIDKYFDTLGGISKAVERARGTELPVYIGDQTVGDGRVRTLSEQVALETRTRMLNPKWYEGMLKHGYEGVRQIEQHVANTLGWSATTGQVGEWVYQRISETFVLDGEMRERLATLNPAASAKLANRLLEASQRQYWKPDEEMLAALRSASEELEDRLEGVFEGVPQAVAA